jgi:hypothetical protein
MYWRAAAHYKAANDLDVPRHFGVIVQRFSNHDQKMPVPHGSINKIHT